jgi:hypothetical protein
MKEKTKNYIIHGLILFIALLAFAALAIAEYKIYNLGFADGRQWQQSVDQLDYEQSLDKAEGEQE